MHCVMWLQLQAEHACIVGSAKRSRSLCTSSAAAWFGSVISRSVPSGFQTHSQPSSQMHLVCLFISRHAVWAPPTVADAKMKFIGAFKKPLPGLYSTIVQELLVQQHLFRWNKKYQYNEVNRLACVSSTHGWVNAGLSGWPQADNLAMVMCRMLHLS